MMDEFILNEVEGKEFFTIKMVCLGLYSQYSRIPEFHYSILMVQIGFY